MARIDPGFADSPGRNAASEQLKQSALRLFAAKGVNGVSVREIAAAAGHRNNGAVGYYFGSKDALIRAITMDCAVALEQLRNDALDALEAKGGPNLVREVVDVLVRSVTAMTNEYHISFITLFGMTHRELMFDAIDPRFNRAYRRCLDHLRRLLPDSPPALQNQRFVFMGAYLSSVLATRARALAGRPIQHPMWSGNVWLEHFTQTVVAMLEAPASCSRNESPGSGSRRSPDAAVPPYARKPRDGRRSHEHIG